MVNKPGFFTELKRRHVWRVTVAYAVVVWLLIQVVTQVFPVFHMPEWTIQFVVIVLVLGLPIVVMLAWAFEITSDGIRLTEPPHSTIARKTPDTHAIGRKLDVVIIAMLSIALVVVLANTFVGHKISSSGTTIDVGNIRDKSIAVLPFQNLSNDQDNAYFVTGMRGLILSKLVDVDELKVISPTSTMNYSSNPDNLKQVAAELGVAMILEGSVQKRDNKVLINVQLIDAETNTHLWAESYPRSLNDIFGVEGEVAGKIALALQAELSPSEAARLAAIPTINRAAYDLFLRAEYEADLGQINYDTARWKAAIPLYRQAIAQDPLFALAWARLSFSESALAWFGGGGANPKQLFVQSHGDAERALQLAPNLAAAHIAVGYSYYWGSGDYAAALEAFEAAVSLRPGGSHALAARGYVARRQGRFDAAIASLTSAMTHDPRNSSLAYEIGVTNMMGNHFANAENWFRRALALEPNNALAKARYSQAILLGNGNIARALAAVDGELDALKSQRVQLLTYQRKFEQAIAVLTSIPDTPKLFRVWSGSKMLRLAKLYQLSGNMTKARPLFADALVKQRAQLELHRGIRLVSAWQQVASAELGLGHTAKGLNAIASAQAILDKTQDYTDGPWLTEVNATLYAEAGRSDVAVSLLAKALATPGIGIDYSPVMLWLDPAWDPLRNDANFNALLKKYASHEPQVRYDNPPARRNSSTQSGPH